eukprot:13051215-Heterocapsa_arctica.AAC.1
MRIWPKSAGKGMSPATFDGHVLTTRTLPCGKDKFERRYMKLLAMCTATAPLGCYITIAAIGMS